MELFLGERRRVSVKWNSTIKWMMLGFAFLATVINYLDRQALSVMAPVLLEKFHISATGYSHIVFAFMLAYTLMNGISGRILDWLGTKVGYALTIAFWSGAEVLHAFSAGALSLGICRFLLGIGEAGNYPAGVKLIGEWFPPEERSLASGVFNSGASIGAILAPPLGALMILNFGWRMAFVLVGLLGFAWLICWIFLYLQPAAVTHERREERVPLRSLLGSKFLWQFTLSKFFSDPVWYFYTFWFPQYLRVAHGFSLARIGEIAWIPFFAAAIGNLGGGAVFGALLPWIRSVARARRVAVLIFSTLMAAVVFIGEMRTATECVALISIATFGYSGALANLLAIPGDAFPKGTLASVWGLASTGSGFGGMVFSLITGWLVDRYSFRPAFIVFGSIPLLAAWLVWTLPNESATGLGKLPGPAPSMLD
jgi:MFS transporter, ACS family, aldohexuronate transporter